MFVDEIAKKLKLDGDFPPFVVTILGSGKAIVNGVKTVILSTQNEVKVKVRNAVVKVSGEGLNLLEMGGGDLYLEGEIASVEIEKN